MNIIRTIALFCLSVSTVQAKDISSIEIDHIVENAMEVFSVPGISVGVIQNGKVTHAKGYGVRSLNDGGAVDEHTYFGIASNSKGFTATALAILVDEGKIAWDDKVKDYLPEFRLWDPHITENFTIRDLLAHATGLPLGSGDLMWWPDANYSPDEVIRNMRHLKPNRGIRTTYEYNNLPFVVAGAIIPAVTGKNYQDFLQERIFDPLDMDRCTANTPNMATDGNLAESHAVLEGNLKQIKRYLILDRVVGSMAAAGIQCSVDDLLKWELMHISGGKGLMKAETHASLWQVNTPFNISESQRKNGTNFAGYGLGYTLSDYHGNRVVGHGGALIGMYSNLTMVPELGFGVVITTNQQSSAAHAFIKDEILNNILDIDNKSTARQRFENGERKRLKEVERLSALKGNGKLQRYPGGYVGLYSDPWWQDVEISQKDGSLYFTSSRSPALRGRMEHFEADTFIVRWDDRTHEADAFVEFQSTNDGPINGFTMKAVSIRTDFSYDFHHVNMVKR